MPRAEKDKKDAVSLDNQISSKFIIDKSNLKNDFRNAILSSDIQQEEEEDPADQIPIRDNDHFKKIVTDYMTVAKAKRLLKTLMTACTQRQTLTAISYALNLCSHRPDVVNDTPPASRQEYMDLINALKVRMDLEFPDTGKD